MREGCGALICWNIAGGVLTVGKAGSSVIRVPLIVVEVLVSFSYQQGTVNARDVSIGIIVLFNLSISASGTAILRIHPITILAGDR